MDSKDISYQLTKCVLTKKEAAEKMKEFHSSGIDDKQTKDAMAAELVKICLDSKGINLDSKSTNLDSKGMNLDSKGISNQLTKCFLAQKEVTEKTKEFDSRGIDDKQMKDAMAAELVKEYLVPKGINLDSKGINLDSKDISNQLTK